MHKKYLHKNVGNGKKISSKFRYLYLRTRECQAKKSRIYYSRKLLSYEQCLYRVDAISDDISSARLTYPGLNYKLKFSFGLILLKWKYILKFDPHSYIRKIKIQIKSCIHVRECSVG